MRHLEAERDEKQAQFVETVGIRARMHAIKARNPMTTDELRRLDVGGDHAFLDQPSSLSSKRVCGRSISIAPRRLRALASAL